MAKNKSTFDAVSRCRYLTHPTDFHAPISVQGIATMYLGIDFGTTNTALAIADDAGDIQTAVFPLNGASTASFRSILCFLAEETTSSRAVSTSAGPFAIRDYLEHGAEARLIQSIKTFLSSAAFETTSVFGRTYAIEELIAIILRHLQAACSGLFETLPRSVVAGRPVKFAGENPKDDLAVRRLRSAFSMAGFNDVSLAYEPLAAAYFYARGLEQPEICLVADFGGGTSDFSAVHFEPGSDGPQAMPLAHAGVGIAGDSFDYRIVQHVVCPRLGRGSYYRSFGKRLEIPKRYYTQFERWHHLSILRQPRTLREMHQIRQTSEQPEQVAHLIHVIEHELGFHLYQAVNRAKAALSNDEETEFAFHHPPLEIQCTIRRQAFEEWITRDLAGIDEALTRVLASAGLDRQAITRVFMTGGTSMVPAVRRLFEMRFGAERLVYGDEFLSVASGLALIHRAHARGNRLPTSTG